MPKIRTEALVADLQAQIEAGQVLVIAGAGVSVAATTGGTPGSNRAASWKGLLADGIERCGQVGSPLPAAGWGERLRADLDSTDLDDLLSVAERVASRADGRRVPPLAARDGRRAARQRPLGT